MGDLGLSPVIKVVTFVRTQSQTSNWNGRFESQTGHQ